MKFICRQFYQIRRKLNQIELKNKHIDVVIWREWKPYRSDVKFNSSTTCWRCNNVSDTNEIPTSNMSTILDINWIEQQHELTFENQHLNFIHVIIMCKLYFSTCWNVWTSRLASAPFLQPQRVAFSKFCSSLWSSDPSHPTSELSRRNIGDCSVQVVPWSHHSVNQFQYEQPRR